MCWVKETGLLSIKELRNYTPISDPEVKTSSNINEFEFYPTQLTGSLNGSEMIGVRIIGELGNEKYSGTFTIGKAYDYQVIATRRALGLIYSNVV